MVRPRKSSWRFLLLFILLLVLYSFLSSYVILFAGIDSDPQTQTGSSERTNDILIGARPDAGQEREARI